MRNVSSLALAALLASAALLPFSRPLFAQQTNETLAKEWFVEHDRDHDGYITLDEIHEYYRALLQSADQNQDGRITWEEFKAVAGGQ